jgi:hypothetical protein
MWVKWSSLISFLDLAEPLRCPAKVATAPSANIFTNREYEMLLRSQNVRRLSFVVFTGEKNHFLTYLPTIQEKLVDILRNVTAPIVQSEVFLCVRVLLCRLSKHNLTSFWPVLLTELVFLFVPGCEKYRLNQSLAPHLWANHDKLTSRRVRRSTAGPRCL